MRALTLLFEPFSELFDFKKAFLYFPKRKKKLSKVLETTTQYEGVTTSYNGGRQKDIGQAHLSFVQLVEKRSLKLGGFNWEEIERLRVLLGNLEKPLGTYSLVLLGKFPIPIGLKVSNETFANSWVINLGVTNHIIHSSYQFNNYNFCPINRKIVTIDGSLTTIAGVGDI